MHGCVQFPRQNRNDETDGVSDEILELGRTIAGQPGSPHYRKRDCHPGGQQEASRPEHDGGEHAANLGVNPPQQLARS
jgi:hypothetical protein